MERIGTVHRTTFVHSGLWQVLLRHLELRTAYRLIMINRESRKVIGVPFWRDRIARDLGIVPDFVKNYKLYYLKQTHFGIPLEMYRVENGKLIPEDDGIIEANYYVRLTPTMIKNQEGAFHLDGHFTSFRQLISIGVLAVDGTVYNLFGDKINPPVQLPRGEVLTYYDSATDTSLTKRGNVYNSEGERVVFPEPMVRNIVIFYPEPMVIPRDKEKIHYIGKSGKNYHYNRSTSIWEATSDLVPSSPTNLVELSEYASKYYIDLSGVFHEEHRVRERNWSSDPRYFIVEYYIDNKNIRHLRGFKK